MSLLVRLLIFNEATPSLSQQGAMERHRAPAVPRGSPYPVAKEARAGVLGVDVPDEGKVHVLHKDQKQQPLHAD